MKNPKILLTGLADTNQRFASKLTNYEVINFPLQRSFPCIENSIDISKFDYILFTSSIAVGYFDGTPTPQQFISIGEETSKAIKQKYGKQASIIQSFISNSVALVDFLKSKEEVFGKKVFHPCSALADNYLRDNLNFLNYKRLNIYTLREMPTNNLPNFDAIFFFSSSAVNTFLNSKHYALCNLGLKEVIALGETTSQELQNYGIQHRVWI